MRLSELYKKANKRLFLKAILPLAISFVKNEVNFYLMKVHR